MTSSYQNVIRLLLVMTNLHISLEAVEWRLVQVTFDLLRLKCVFLNSPILVLNIILHMSYILTLYIYIYIYIYYIS